MVDSIGSGNIRFGGLASGLDTNAIIEALIGVERLPINRLQFQKSRLSQQDGIFSKLDTKLDELKTALQALDTPAEFGAYKATSSNEQAALATASGNAVAGTYSLSVTQLAQTESRVTGGFADSNTTNIGTGTIGITINGQTTNIALGGPTNTLEQVRDAINNSSAKVNATIINDGAAGTPYRLVVTSEDSGATGAYSVDLSAFTAASPNFNFTTQLQQGRDSIAIVNGITVTRSSNTVSDVIQGVTFDLKSQGAAATSTVTVAQDNAAIKAKLETFVKAYNEIVSILAPQNTVDEKGKTTAVLFGDSGLRSISSRLRSAVTTTAQITGTNFTSLAAAGVTTGSDGKLKIDATKLENALNTDLTGVTNLFTTSNDGVAKNIKAAVDDLTNPTNGVIKSRRDGIKSRIGTIDDRVEDLERRISSVEKRLISKFSTLETLVSRLQAQGSSVSALG